MMNQRVLGEPAVHDNSVVDGFLIWSDSPIGREHPKVLTDVLKAAMVRRLAPPPPLVQNLPNPIALNQGIVEFYNIKAFYDSHCQSVGAGVRIPDEFGNMMLSHRGVVVNSAFLSREHS